MTLPKFIIILTAFLLTIMLTASCHPGRSNKKALSAVNHQSVGKVFFGNLPQQIGRVNDFEHLFSDREALIIDSLIRDFEKITTVQIALITIDTAMVSEDSLDAFTLRIANLWGVGQKDKHNGVVIGISSGYRRMRIQNGYGIEKILTDAETQQIIDTTFIPRFRDAKYFEGTVNGLAILMKKLKERYK